MEFNNFIIRFYHAFLVLVSKLFYCNNKKKMEFNIKFSAVKDYRNILRNISKNFSPRRYRICLKFFVRRLRVFKISLLNFLRGERWSKVFASRSRVFKTSLLNFLRRERWSKVFIVVYYRKSLTSLKSFFGKILFGKDFDLRLGTYEKDNPNRLTYPIIILNGKVLLELDTNSPEKTISKFPPIKKIKNMRKFFKCTSFRELIFNCFTMRKFFKYKSSLLDVNHAFFFFVRRLRPTSFRELISNCFTMKLSVKIKKIVALFSRDSIRTTRRKLKDISLFFYNRSLIAFKSFVGKILFGKDFDLRLGSYEKDNPNRLSYPIIILNGKVLVELDTSKEETIFNFFRALYEHVDFDTSRSVFRSKLKDLLEGRNFPIESFHVPVEESIEGTYIYSNTEIPMDDRYRPTRLPLNFALNIHQISQEADYKEFLNYILSFYFRFNILHKDEVEDYGFESDEIHNLFMTYDISQFIIFQEQADAYANFLEKHFKEEIDYRRENGLQTTFGDWFAKLIKNLRKASLPSKKEKVKKWQIMLFIFSPFLPFLGSFLMDICGYLIFGYYGIVFIGIILSVVLNKCKRLIYCDDLSTEIKLIYYEIITFLNNNYKTFLISYALAQLNPFLNRVMIPLKIIFGMLPFPLISSLEFNNEVKLYSNNLYNSIKLSLGAKYINNLKAAHQHFKLDLQTSIKMPERDILKGVGLSMQEVRAANPRLFNHNFLKQYGFIYEFDVKGKALTSDQQKIILDRLKRSLELAIQESIEIPAEWYQQICSGDKDQLGSRFPNCEITSILQLMEREQVSFNESYRPALKGNGDVIIKTQGGSKNHYDFKNGISVFYKRNFELDKAPSCKIKYDYAGHRIKIVFETPNTVPISEINAANNLLSENPESSHMSCLNPYDSDYERKIKESAENNCIAKRINSEAKYIGNSMKKDFGSNLPGVSCTHNEFGNEFNETVETQYREKIEQTNNLPEKFDYESLD